MFPPKIPSPFTSVKSEEQRLLDAIAALQAEKDKKQNYRDTCIAQADYWYNEWLKAADEAAQAAARGDERAAEFWTQRANSAKDQYNLWLARLNLDFAPIG